MDIIGNLISKFTLLKNSSPTLMSIWDEDVSGIINYDLQLDNANYETTQVCIESNGSIGLQCTQFWPIDHSLASSVGSYWS